MKKIMVVAAYKLSLNGEGDSLPYDSYVVHVVDCDRTDADHVGVRRDSYFWNPFVLLLLEEIDPCHRCHLCDMNCDAASFLNDLDDPLCALAALGDLVPAASTLVPLGDPSPAAGDDSQPCTLCPYIERHNHSL